MHTPIFAFDLMGDKTQNIVLAKNDFLNLTSEALPTLSTGKGL
jgi:hypothetical protein